MQREKRPRILRVVSDHRSSATYVLACRLLPIDPVLRRCSGLAVQQTSTRCRRLGDTLLRRELPDVSVTHASLLEERQVPASPVLYSIWRSRVYLSLRRSE